MLDKVNFDYYSNVMGRSVVPDVATFDSLAFEQKAIARTLHPFIVEEREEDGFVKAVCMWVEEAFNASKTKTMNGAIKTSESLDGYSVSFDTSKAESFEDRKKMWLDLFCNVAYGVR